MSQLTVFQEPLRYLEQLWMHKLFPVGTSNRRKAVLTISSAVGLLVCRHLYNLLHVPRNLQHLPAVSFFANFMSIIRPDPPLKRVQNVIGPALAKGNGVYIGNFPVKWTVFIAEPNTAKALLMKPNVFPKSLDIFDALGEQNPLVRFFGKKNVALVNGHVWKSQRKVMNPAFHKSMPVALFGELMQKGYQIIERDGNQLRCLDFFHRLTLDALGLGSFGFDFHALDDPNSVWTTTYEHIRRGFRSPYTFLFPKYDWLLRHIIPGRKQFDASVTKLNALLLDMAHKKRQEIKANAQDDSVPEAEKDLLTLMLEAEMRGEGMMSDDELRSNLAIFFLAGQETTANAMSFFMYNLAVNKDVQTKARQEVLDLLGDAPEDARPTLAETRKLPYLDMVLKENLRRYGPAGMLSARMADEDTVVNGIVIPKKTPVVVDVQSLHHNPSVWKNPGKFDPMRFAQGGEHDTTHHEGGDSTGLAWMPFSGGQRMCIGMNFSLSEQRTFAAMLLRKYEWELPADSRHKDEVQMPSFQNTCPDDLIVKLTPRY
ncbi:cytochrome P450 [Gongronella butleri]|nr:cytochrome P450 [Gongronella butleri]